MLLVSFVSLVFKKAWVPAFAGMSGGGGSVRADPGLG
jgi:hypothetical protein